MGDEVTVRVPVRGIRVEPEMGRWMTRPEDDDADARTLNARDRIEAGQWLVILDGDWAPGMAVVQDVRGGAAWAVETAMIERRARD